jgi:flagellar biogenesis protein FliO
MKPTLSAKESSLTSLSTNRVVSWLLDRTRNRPKPRSRLAVLERIALAPRHSLALIEAEGRKLLVATSQDGAPVFYALDAIGQSMAASRHFVSARRNSC